MHFKLILNMKKAVIEIADSCKWNDDHSTIFFMNSAKCFGFRKFNSQKSRKRCSTQFKTMCSSWFTAKKVFTTDSSIDVTAVTMVWCNQKFVIQPSVIIYDSSFNLFSVYRLNLTEESERSFPRTCIDTSKMLILCLIANCMLSSVFYTTDCRIDHSMNVTMTTQRNLMKALNF